MCQPTDLDDVNDQNIESNIAYDKSSTENAYSMDEALTKTSM